MGAIRDAMDDKQAQGYVLTPEQMAKDLQDKANEAQARMVKAKDEMMKAETEMKKLQAAHKALTAPATAKQHFTVERKQGISATLRPFVCSGVAACTASFVIHPIDLAKVRLQLASAQGLPKQSFVGMIGTMAKNEGISACYAGLTASIARQAIYGTARLALHSIFSDKLKEMQGGGSLPFWKSVVSGMGSGAIAVCIGTPFDVALVRMQADGMKPAAERRGYKNVVDAVIRVSSEEGPAKLWSGLTPNIYRGISMNVGMMAFYDQAKEIVGNMVNDPDLSRPLLVTKLGSAAVAGFMCAFLSLPFDMIKSRLQDMKPLKDGTMPYKGVGDCMRKLIAAEGVPALWTGFSAYYFRCAPHAMTILLVREEIYKMYDSMTGREVAGLLE